MRPKTRSRPTYDTGQSDLDVTILEQRTDPRHFSSFSSSAVGIRQVVGLDATALISEVVGAHYQVPCCEPQLARSGSEPRSAPTQPARRRQHQFTFTNDTTEQALKQVIEQANDVRHRPTTHSSRNRTAP